MEIITGRTGKDHVYAADDAELYRMFIGSGDYVFRTGNQFSATMYGAYTIRVSDGSLMTQGRLAKIRPTDGYDELQFDVGVAGYRRADLVVAEYRRTVTTHEEEVEIGGKPTIVEVSDELEDISLVVLKGANNTGTYITPTYATGNIDRGEVHQIPLWEVRYNGVNFESLIDRRIFLDGVPYDTLIAHSQAIYAQANARVDDALAQVEVGLNRLRNMVDVAPLTRLWYEKKSTNPSRKPFSRWQDVNTTSASTIKIEPFGTVNTTIDVNVWGKLKRNGRAYKINFQYGVATSKTLQGVSITYDGALTFTVDASAGQTFDKWALQWTENNYLYSFWIPFTELDLNPNDVLILYLNGLRVLPNKYAVRYEVNTEGYTGYSDCRVFLLGATSMDVYDEVEIEVWRPETE